jgi:hypothetical protein
VRKGEGGSGRVGVGCGEGVVVSVADAALLGFQ